LEQYHGNHRSRSFGLFVFGRFLRNADCGTSDCRIECRFVEDQSAQDCFYLREIPFSNKISVKGINSGVPPLYFTEISTPGLRGALGSVHQLFVTIAIWISQILGMPYILGTYWGWPILVGLSAVPAIYQLFALPFCPESPKFLYMGKRDEKGARKGIEKVSIQIPTTSSKRKLYPPVALEKLRATASVEEEIEEIRVEYEKTKDLPSVSIGMLFRDPFLRKVTLIAAGLMVCQQLSGIDAVRTHLS
jgi:Sugar (and other) transporter